MELEQLLSMLVRAGIEFTKHKESGRKISVNIYSEDKGRKSGYSEFFTVLTFDENGSLMEYAVWQEQS